MVHVRHTSGGRVKEANHTNYKKKKRKAIKKERK